jgi:hypothetical protein
VAYQDLQRFQLKIILKLKIMFLGKRDLHRLQLRGMILGNRNIISPFRVRGVRLPLRVGVQVALKIKLILAYPLLV